MPTAETYRVRQPGGTITLTADKRLMVEPDGREERPVCCLDKAVAVLRAWHRQQQLRQRNGTMETEPSVARWASLLLGALAAAYGAIIELRDCGYAHTPEADRYVATYQTATALAAKAYQQLREQREEVIADKTLEPILQAITLVSEECARLSGEAKEQADYDIKFADITDHLKGNG